MKKFSLNTLNLLLIAILLLALSNCGPSEKEVKAHHPVIPTVHEETCEHYATKQVEQIPFKIVKSKKEAVETTYKHKFSLWKGDFVLQPDVKTVYYLVFQDGTYQTVGLTNYSLIEIGDTVRSRY